MWRARRSGCFGLPTLDRLLGNAVGTGQRLRCAWLVERGADPNALHVGTRQPVHAVAHLSGVADIQRVLVEHSAHPVELAGADALRAARLCHDETGARALLATQRQIIRDACPDPVRRDARGAACLGAFDRLTAVLDAEPLLANERLAEVPPLG